MRNKVNLYNDDCLEVMDKLIAKGVQVDAIITDPPYKITSRGSSGGTGGILKTKESLKGNLFKEVNFDLNEGLIRAYQLLKETGHGYIFTNNKNLQTHLKLVSSMFNVFKVLIWVKDNCITNMYYMDSHEYIIFFREGKAKKINNCGTRTVLHYKNPRPKVHPTEKPIDLLEVLIANSTNEGETVLDFTMGSGTTGVACKNLNRKFIGIELDEKYFNIAKERIKSI